MKIVTDISEIRRLSECVYCRQNAQESDIASWPSQIVGILFRQPFDSHCDRSESRRDLLRFWWNRVHDQKKWSGWNMHVVVCHRARQPKSASVLNQSLEKWLNSTICDRGQWQIAEYRLGFDDGIRDIAIIDSDNAAELSGKLCNHEDYVMHFMVAGRISAQYIASFFHKNMVLSKESICLSTTASMCADLSVVVACYGGSFDDPFSDLIVFAPSSEGAMLAIY